MSNDLIRRSDAIETAYQLRHKPNDEEWGDWLKSFNAIPSADRPQEWIPSMSACCRTCEYRLDGVKSDHTLFGSGIDIDSDMDGFICLALAYEGVAHWMLGVDEDKGICEMYKERSRR